jgi:hypothetical protein
MCLNTLFRATAPHLHSNIILALQGGDRNAAQTPSVPWGGEKGDCDKSPALTTEWKDKKVGTVATGRWYLCACVYDLHGCAKAIHKVVGIHM